MTKQRALILQLLRATKKHPTAEEIFLEAQAHMPGIARATVYNNLNALVAAGEVVRLRSDGGADHFDGTVAPHAHLFCDRCGSIRDTDIPEEILSRFAVMHGAEPRSIELTAHCLCEACRNTQSSTL